MRCCNSRCAEEAHEHPGPLPHAAPGAGADPPAYAHSLQRWLAEQRRRLHREPHRVLYFHQVDDPYSQLAAQVNDYRRLGEEVVVLEIESGLEVARVRTGGLNQGVVFPSPGWGRDLYWCSMGRLARIFVR